MTCRWVDFDFPADDGAVEQLCLEHGERRMFDAGMTCPGPDPESCCDMTACRSCPNDTTCACPCGCAIGPAIEGVCGWCREGGHYEGTVA